MKGCFFHDSLGYSGCGGRTERAHLIPAQRIKRYDPIRAYDPRVIVPACRKHHTLFDNKTIRLRYEQYPPSVKDFAHEHRWYYAGTRDGWLKEAPPAPRRAA